MRNGSRVWMVWPLGLLALAGLLSGQTAGTVTVVTTVTIASTAGTAPNTVTCNFTGNATTAQVLVSCTGAGATLSSTLPLPLPSPGTVGTFNLSGNIITWSFVPYTAANPGGVCPTGVTSGTCWQVGGERDVEDGSVLTRAGVLYDSGVRAGGGGPTA